MRRTGATALAVKPRWAERCHRWLLSTTRGTAWAVSNNDFKSETGAIVTQWAYRPLAYWLLTTSLGPLSQTSRTRGDVQPAR